MRARENKMPAGRIPPAFSYGELSRG